MIVSDGEHASELPVFQRFKQLFFNYQVVKFIISGSTAAGVNFILLYILTDKLGMWYLLSSTITFIVTFFTAFFLQKFWTFKSRSMTYFHRQVGLSFSIALFNLILNASGMYILVDFFGLWYMLAQAIVLGTIATWSFVAYKFIVFAR